MHCIYGAGLMFTFCIEYRSGIYTHSDEQMRIAKEVTDQVQKDHFTPEGKTITTEIVPAGTWYDAEVSAGLSSLCSRLSDAIVLGVSPEVSR